MSDSRTAAQIEAELEAARLALTDTVNELHYRIKPSTQINNAKAKAKEFAGKVKSGDGKAIAITTGIVLGISALIAIPFLKKRS